MKKIAYLFVALMFAGATVSFAGENGTCANGKTCTKGASASTSCHKKDASATATSGCDMSKMTTASTDYGKCPVSGHDATKKVTYKYKGVTYHFCCKDCIKDFKADPTKYMTAVEKTDNTKTAQ